MCVFLSACTPLCVCHPQTDSTPERVPLGTFPLDGTRLTCVLRSRDNIHPSSTAYPVLGRGRSWRKVWEKSQGTCKHLWTNLSLWLIYHAYFGKVEGKKGKGQGQDTAHKGARRDSNSELYNCEADVRAIMYHRVTQQHNLVKT